MFTETQLQTMFDKANDFGILPFIQKVTFQAPSEEGKSGYAYVEYMMPRQRKPKTMLYHFGCENFYSQVRRRKQKTAKVA